MLDAQMTDFAQSVAVVCRLTGAVRGEGAGLRVGSQADLGWLLDRLIFVGSSPGSKKIGLFALVYRCGRGQASKIVRITARLLNGDGDERQSHTMTIDGQAHTYITNAFVEEAEGLIAALVEKGVPGKLRPGRSYISRIFR